MKSRSPVSYSVSLLIALLLFASTAIAQVQLTYDQQVFDFGHVGIDFSVHHTYKIPNIGKTAIRLTKLEINCDCTAARIIDSVIPPGDTGRVQVTFTTKDYYGPANKSIKIYTNNSKSPNFDLYYVSIIGQWDNGIKPTPVSLFFLPGKPAQNVEIPSVMHDLAEADSVFTEDTIFTVKTIKAKAAKNEKLIFEVTPNPHLGKGSYIGNFSIYIRFDNDTQAEPTILTIPAKIVLF